MLQKLRVNQKGFTLIELMIVIAIIGILAAIAIPQFANYRMKSYNSSGQSDVRNLATSQAAFFSDWQVFGGSDWTAAAPILVWAGHAGGVAANVLKGPVGNPAGGAFVPGITASVGVPVANQGTQIALGNNVYLVSHTNAAAAGIAANTTFTGATKHTNGDMYFAVDSDVTAVYFAQVQNSAGTILASADCQASAAGDDFQGQTVGAPATAWQMR